MKSSTLNPKGRVTVQEKKPTIKPPSSSSAHRNTTPLDNNESIERRRAALVLQREIQRRQAFENKPHTVIHSTENTAIKSPSLSSSSKPLVVVSPSTSPPAATSRRGGGNAPSSIINSSPKTINNSNNKVKNKVKSNETKDVPRPTINIDDDHNNHHHEETVVVSKNHNEGSTSSSSSSLSSIDSLILPSHSVSNNATIPSPLTTQPPSSSTIPPSLTTTMNRLLPTIDNNNNRTPTSSTKSSLGSTGTVLLTTVPNPIPLSSNDTTNDVSTVVSTVVLSTTVDDQEQENYPKPLPFSSLPMTINSDTRTTSRRNSSNHSHVLNHEIVDDTENMDQEKDNTEESRRRNTTITMGIPPTIITEDNYRSDNDDDDIVPDNRSIDIVTLLPAITEPKEVVSIPINYAPTVVPLPLLLTESSSSSGSETVTSSSTVLAITTYSNNTETTSTTTNTIRGNNPFIYDFHDQLLSDDELRKLSYPTLPAPVVELSSPSLSVPVVVPVNNNSSTIPSAIIDSNLNDSATEDTTSLQPPEYVIPTPRANDYSTKLLLHLYSTLTIDDTNNLVKDDMFRIMNQRRYNYPLSFQVSLVNEFLSELRTIPVPKPIEECSTGIFTEHCKQAQTSAKFAATSVPSSVNNNKGTVSSSSNNTKKLNNSSMVTMSTQTVPLSSFSEAIHEGKIPFQPNLSLSQLAEYAILHDQTNNASNSVTASTTTTSITADPLSAWLWFISFKRDLEIIWQAALLFEYNQQQTGSDIVRSNTTSSVTNKNKKTNSTDREESIDNNGNLFVYSMYPELIQIDHIIRVFERLRIHELSLPAVACGIRAILGLLGYGGLNQVTEGIMNMYYPSTCRSSTRFRLIREALSSLGTIGFGNGDSTLVGTPLDFQWLYGTAPNEETGATVSLPMDDGEESKNRKNTNDYDETNTNDDVLLPLPLRCTVFTSSTDDLIPSLHALTGCEQTVQRLGYDKDGICYGPSVRIVISAEDFSSRLVQASDTVYNAFASLREAERRKKEEKRVIDYAQHINEPTMDTVRSVDSTTINPTTARTNVSSSSTNTISGENMNTVTGNVNDKSDSLPPLPSPWANLSYTTVLSLGPVTYDILDMALTDTLTVTNLEAVYNRLSPSKYRQRSDFLRRTIITPMTIIKKDRLGNEIEYMNPLLSPEEKEQLDIHEVSSIMIPTLRRTFAQMRECYFYSVYQNMFTDKLKTESSDDSSGNGTKISVDFAMLEKETKTTNTYLHLTAVEYPPSNTYRTLGPIAMDRSSHQPLGYTVPLPLSNSSTIVTTTRRYVRGIAWNKLLNAEPLQTSEVYPYSNQSTIVRLWSRLIHSDEDHARHKRAHEETQRAIAAVSLANLFSSP